MTTAGLLLAAGHSRRFGAQDKLLAKFRGNVLISHAATALHRCPLDHRIAVIRNPALQPYLSGFHVVQLADDDGPQAASLVAGIQVAKSLGVSRALVSLADMPGVTPSHLNSVLQRAGKTGESCSSDGEKRLPPACFSEHSFDRLMALSGDHGAGQFLRAMPGDQVVRALPFELMDIDLPTQLE